MKPTILILSAIFLMSCCPDYTTKTETNSGDSLSVKKVTENIVLPSVNDTLKQWGGITTGSITIPDSVAREWRMPSNYLGSNIVFDTTKSRVWMRIDINNRITFDTSSFYYKLIRNYFAPPIIEFESKKGKARLDQTDLNNRKLTYNRPEDSLKIEREEKTYWKWMFETKSNIEQPKQKSWLDKLVDIFSEIKWIVIAVIGLTVIIYFARKK